MLVGDTQRIWVYADAGYAEPQAISNDAMDAYRRLVDAGYTRGLIDRPRPEPIAHVYRTWLPSVSRSGPEWGRRLSLGGSGKWLVRSAGVGM